MVLESLLFWCWGWVCLELCRGRFVATQLALTLSFLLLLTVLLLTLGLDLLAVFIGSVYSSVFVAVALIALQFGPFWAAASRVSPDTSLEGRFPFWALVLLSLACIGVLGTAALPNGWAGTLLWQELSDEPGVGLSLQSVALHWFFFRCFILETLALNLYLFLGLVGVVLLLLLRVVDRGRGVGNTLVPENFERIRLLARLRRQVRRTHASRLRSRR